MNRREYAYDTETEDMLISEEGTLLLLAFCLPGLRPFRFSHILQTFLDFSCAHDFTASELIEELIRKDIIYLQFIHRLERIEK